MTKSSGSDTGVPRSWSFPPIHSARNHRERTWALQGLHDLPSHMLSKPQNQFEKSRTAQEDQKTTTNDAQADQPSALPILGKRLPRTKFYQLSAIRTDRVRVFLWFSQLRGRPYHSVPSVAPPICRHKTVAGPPRNQSRCVQNLFH